MFIVLKKKIIIAVAACILTIIAIPVAIHYTNNAAEAVQASTSANTNWGLSFPNIKNVSVFLFCVLYGVSCAAGLIY